MAVQARYTAPIQVVETPEKRQRIEAIADREGVSQAQVIRELIDVALPAREALSLDRFGG